MDRKKVWKQVLLMSCLQVSGFCVCFYPATAVWISPNQKRKKRLDLFFHHLLAFSLFYDPLLKGAFLLFV